MIRRGIVLLAALLSAACGESWPTGSYRGEHAMLGEITLNLDTDGHYEATLEKRAWRADSAVGDGAASELSVEHGYAERTIAYGGGYEVRGDTVWFTAGAPFRYAHRRGKALLLVLPGDSVLLEP